jgi:uncharacterized integral membrane protein
MSTEAPGPTKRKDGWTISALIAVLLLIWFAAVNSGSVGVHFWVVSVHAPLIVVIIAAALLGALVVELWRRARHPH